MRKILGIIVFCSLLFSNEITVEQLFNIKLVEVKKLQISESSRYYGYVVQNEKNIYDHNIRFSGFVERIYADETYLNIKEGDRLFDIYSNEIITAQSELLNAIAFKQDRAKKAAVERLILLGVEKSTIEEIEKKRVVKELIPVYAKNSGIIYKKNINKGSFLKAGETAYEIVDIRKLWVEAKIYQNDLGSIKEGMSTRLFFDGVDESYSSKIDKILPSVDLNEKSVNIRIEVENSKLELFPGMFAKVDIIKDNREMLVLPKSAVLIKDDIFVVFKKSEYEGEYDPIEIEARKIDSHNYEVISGLEEGEEVADKALFMLDSDAQINGLY